jgi:molybdopterin molybdotransferase
MKTAAEALELLLVKAQTVKETELVTVQEALGRILAVDQISQVNVPPADNTQMDGYVMRAADILQAGAVLTVSQRIPAGSVGTTLTPGTMARIFTGANIPAGADAVVMQEDCEVMTQPNSEGVEYSVKVKQVPKSGQWIRNCGEDIQAGQVVLTQGTFLRPQELGVAASVGITHLEVFRRVKVAVFFTGDELTLPGQPLKPGGIYNSNRDTLLACLNALGCDTTDFGIVPDTLASTRQTLRQAAIGHDLIVTSGGVSVGEEDHIKPAVTAEGSLDMWQIAIKPGKPLAFGQIPKGTDQTWFMGLPGNPVSSFVTFLLFVRPFILALQGRETRALPKYPLIANFNWSKPDRRNEFLRVRLNEVGTVDLFANQSSGVLTSASWGDGLIDVPAGTPIAKGDTVHFIPFTQFFL